MISVFKRLARRALHSIGLDDEHLQRLGMVRPVSRYSLSGALRQARAAGLGPACIIDVGAAQGTFSLQCHKIFPNSKYILIEPLQEFKPALDSVVARIGTARHIQAAAGSAAGATVLHVHQDLFGSSLYQENEDSDVNGQPRKVRALTLDEIRDEQDLAGPFLVKIDVQGAELDVLAGALQILRDTQYLILEVSCFHFFQGGPQLFDVVTAMKQHGFAVYDVLDPQYRPFDGALSQVDMVFVREDGPFRKHHFFATRAQRTRQTKQIQKAMDHNPLLLGR
jgi:FkbM family methyltransferase